MALMTPSFLPSQTYPFGPGSGKVGLRFLFEQMAMQEGVVEPTAMKVSQRAAGGAGMFVDIAVGGVWVRGDDTARQGYYHGYNDAVVTVAVPANASGNPRFDQLICRNYDAAIAGVTDGMFFEVLQGTPTLGTTIDSRVGAAALPNGAVRLGEWVTPNAAAAIIDSMIRDRRPRARGFDFSLERVAGDLAFPAAGGGFGNIDAATMQQRIETSGNPIEIDLVGVAINTGASGGLLQLRTLIDGAAAGAESRVSVGVNPSYGSVPLAYRGAPAAGTHLITPSFAQGTGMATTLQSNATMGLGFSIRERVGNSGSNGAT